MDGSSGRDEAYRLVYVARSADEVVRRYLNRLRRLRDEGFEVHVLAGAGEGLDRLAAEGFFVQPIPIKNPRNVPGLAGSYFIIQGYLLEHRPVLVHSFGHRAVWQTTFAAKQAQVHAVFTTLDYHWLDEEPFYIPLGPLASFGVPTSVEHAEKGLNKAFGSTYRRSMYGAYKWLAAEVDRYVVTTEFDFQLLQDMEIVAPEKLEIAIGGAGVDLTRFSFPEDGDADREGARRALGLPGHWRQVVGWVGPLTRRHGADDLIEVIENVSRSHPSTGWLVVGQRRMASGQIRRFRRLEREGKIRLMEGREADAEIYRALDILAWPGRPSTPHDAILEAAAMAVPTVGYETPGARSLVQPGQTGLLVFEDDREALAANIGRLLRDPTLLRDLGRRARSRAGVRFSRRAVDDQILRLYDLVLGDALGR